MLSVIMPVYNERTTVREILRRVCAVDIPKEVILVDDASTDGTRATLKNLEAHRPSWAGAEPDNRLVFVFQEKNQGKGAALRAGIARAKEPLTLIQDADLEYDPTEYPKLIEPILKGQADVVYGSRFAGTYRRVLFFWHAVGNRFLTLLSNMFTNLNLTDMETGYKVFKTPLLKSIPLRSNRFGFEPEITAKVAKLGCRVFEVPVNYFGRTYAQGKKIGLKDALQALFVIVKYWLVDDLYTAGTTGLRTLRIMEGAGQYNRWLFRQCEPFLGQRILEMGSGVGNITRFLLDRGLVCATDVDESLLGELEKDFGAFPNVRVFRMDFGADNAVRAVPPGERVDTVLSMNVLEHIKNDRQALLNCRDALSGGGRLVLLVPAHRALYSKMDENLDHHRRYDGPALRKMVEEAGFQNVRWRYLNALGAVGWFVNGKILRRKLLPSRQVRGFDALVWWMEVEKRLRLPFGLSVFLTAEKQ